MPTSRHLGIRRARASGIASRLAVVPLLVATSLGAPATAQQNSPLRFSYAVDQRFTYHIVGGHSSTFGTAERGESDYTIAITGRDERGWHGIETLTHNGKRRDTAFTVASDGTWTRDSDGAVLQNLVSFDPRTICAAPSRALVKGQSWSCFVPGNFVRRPGQERVTVVDASGPIVTLDVVGETGTTNAVQHDTDGTEISVGTHETWHDVITYADGRKIKSETTETHSYAVQSDGGAAVVTMHSLLSGT